MRAPRLALVALMSFSGVAPAPSAGSAEAAEAADEVAACLERNIAEPDTIRAVRISSRDRAGFDRDTVLKMHGRRNAENQRELMASFVEPEDVAGSSFLMLERPGGTEMYFKTSRDLPAKRVAGAGRLLNLLGTDFTYEDFEHLLAFDKPRSTKRLDDDVLRGRKVYVIESLPKEGPGSAYNRIITYVDQEKCVALRTELYEKGKGLRKTLMVNPTHLHKKGNVWIPQLALMEDLLNYTTTVFMVDSTEQAELPDEMFEIARSSD